MKIYKIHKKINSLIKMRIIFKFFKKKIIFQKFLKIQKLTQKKNLKKFLQIKTPSPHLFN